MGALSTAEKSAACCSQACPLGRRAARAALQYITLSSSSTFPTAAFLPCTNFVQDLPYGVLTDFDLRKAVLGSVDDYDGHFSFDPADAMITSVEVWTPSQLCVFFQACEASCVCFHADARGCSGSMGAKDIEHPTFLCSICASIHRTRF